MPRPTLSRSSPGGAEDKRGRRPSDRNSYLRPGGLILDLLLICLQRSGVASLSPVRAFLENNCKEGRRKADPQTYFLPPPFGAGGGVRPGLVGLLPRPPPESRPVLLGPLGGAGRLLMSSSLFVVRIVPPFQTRGSGRQKSGEKMAKSGSGTQRRTTTDWN